MISKVQMVNCQSWRDETFDLATDRLNVIAADNGVGKSVFFKMLKITSDPNYFDRAERKDLIRKHTEFARIIFQFDDGGLAATTVFPTYTLYTYKPADSDTAETSYEPPKRMLEQLGLLTDGTTSFVANMVDADQDLLLVNSRTKYNYNLAKMLAEHADLERVRDYLQKITIDVANPLTSLTNRCTMLDNTITKSAYYDVGLQEQYLHKLEIWKDLLMTSIDIYNDLCCMKEVSSCTIDFDDVGRAIDFEEDLQSLSFNDLIIERKPADVEAEICLLESLEDLQFDDLQVQEKPNGIEKPLQLLESLSNLELEELTVLEQPADLAKELNLLEIVESIDLNELVEMKDVTTFTSYLDACEIFESIAEQLSHISTACEVVRSAELEINKLRTELLESGEVLACPVYGKVVYNGQECVPCSD